MWCTPVRHSCFLRRCSRPGRRTAARTMFETIIARPLQHCRVGLVLAGAMLLYGLWVAVPSPLDVLPDFAPPQANVQTEAPGFAPEQVERLVTLPIETALAGVPGLEALRSESIQGLSVITAVFADASNV